MPWAGEGALRVLLMVVAGAAAMVVMAYPGIVMASSPAIPFWNNMLIPAQFIGFAFASAIALDLGSAAWQATDRTAESSLATAGLVATGAAGLLFLLHVLNGRYGGVAGQASFRRLITGDLRSVFLAALAVGVVVPIAAFAWVLGPGVSGLPLAITVIVAAAAQVGNWLAKYAVIKAGVYPPFL
jgi:formate-dependent nitrite reductase membrane component NrfD